MKKEARSPQEYRYLLILLWGLLALKNESLALTGVANHIHDPSPIIKEGDTYWVYATSYPWTKSPVANGIYTAYSTDMVNWKEGKRIYDGTWPSWINNYSPSFGGNFWAPHVVFMNNKYYMYYACSEWSSTVAAIGVASSPTLDQNSPTYKWTDLGMVVYSASNKDLFAIDPYVFIDTDKRAYLTYGGNLGDGIVELDPATGKIKAGKTVTKVGKGEGTALIKQGNYYYYLQQHGSCCNGVTTNYYINCGRSTTILGPYLDANGVSLATSYGTPVLNKSGRYIGPGHFGLFQENGTSFVSYHYYDGDNNGVATLAIGKLIFVNGWPKVTMDWLDNGNYAVTGLASLKSWEANTSANSISQNTPSVTSISQKWTFAQQGNGIYTIAASNGKEVGITACADANGALLQLGTASNSGCQKFTIEHSINSSYVLTPTNSTKLVGVVGNSMTNGAPMELRAYTGIASQKFLINPFGTVIVTDLDEEDVGEANRGGFCYPNPFSQSFQIESKGVFEYVLFDVAGNTLEKGKGQNGVLVAGSLPAGIYLVKISTPFGDRYIKMMKN
jgi:arabinan endo-1,5-alpha-L-arabinosidase